VPRVARVCFVSREHDPGPGGGIGVSVPATANALVRGGHEVTVITAATNRTFLADHPAAPGVERLFVDTPEVGADPGSAAYDRAWAESVFGVFRSRYGADGPDLVQVPDFRGEGVAIARARRSGHSALKRTIVAVRTHGSAELCALHDHFLRHDPEATAVWANERDQMRLADVLLWPGGDVLDRARRYYGRRSLPPHSAEVRPAFEPSLESEAPTTAPAGPLRLLVVARLQWLKGQHRLLEALAHAEHDWQLTLIGGDTPTAPGRTSVRDALGAISDGDERVVLRDAVPRSQLGAIYASHDVLVIPSSLESWPNVALEALHVGLPVLAAPVGGLPAMVEHGRSGWLTNGYDTPSLAAALHPLLADPDAARSLRAAGEPARRAQRLCEPGAIVAGYERLARSAWRRRRPSRAAVTRTRRPDVVTSGRSDEDVATIEARSESLMAATRWTAAATSRE
jgi:glycosyltransferase involved in cell wall biosynthesis